jgi:hypothetical protein
VLLRGLEWPADCGPRHVENEPQNDLWPLFASGTLAGWHESPTRRGKGNESYRAYSPAADIHCHCRTGGSSIVCSMQEYLERNRSPSGPIVANSYLLDRDNEQQFLLICVHQLKVHIFRAEKGTGWSYTTPRIRISNSLLRIVVGTYSMQNGSCDTDGTDPPLMGERYRKSLDRRQGWGASHSCMIDNCYAPCG